MMPKVSVVIPCFNHGRFLPETLESIQTQTFNDYEIIVVNDGSTDKATVEFLKNLNLPRTKVIHTGNRGVSAARNTGIQAAVGNFILPLDADDTISPCYLEQAVNVLEARPEVSVVYSEVTMFGNKTGAKPLSEYDPKRILVENCVYSAALFRKTDWMVVGGYDEGMKYGWEDWEFWISVSELKGGFYKIPQSLFNYRISDGSRDRSLCLWKKTVSMLHIVAKHKVSYLKNMGTVIGYVTYKIFGNDGSQ